jgi:hypothetical protein
VEAASADLVAEASAAAGPAEAGRLINNFEKYNY